MPFIEQQFFVVVKVLLAAVAADEVSTVVADGQLRDQDQYLLSIAKDLVSLMGGSLSLDIDGDLFKATVTLPKVDLN